MKKEILIVEDNTDTALLLKKRLEHHGYHCTCTADAAQALSQLKKLHPNLLIVDLGLKGADGTAVIKHAQDWLPHDTPVPPILILSGHNEKEVIDYCLENGAKGFLAKPFRPEVLLSMVQDYIA